jgi:hypothetical protein
MSTQTTIHVRFAPDGNVTEIGGRPAGATPQRWFNHLSGTVAGAYRALSGGRGVFTLSPAQIEQAQVGFTAVAG